MRFNPNKLLLDPFARAVSGDLTVDRPSSGTPRTIDRMSESDSAPFVPRAWSSTTASTGATAAPVPLARHRHLRDARQGVDRAPDRVPEELRGTYAGLATPAVVDYLQDLGVTAVELLPIHQFVSEPALVARGSNYWGYNSIGFFAPRNAYSRLRRPGGQVTEFQGDGEGLPRRGARVILDVVYNHTAGGQCRGPTLSFRGPRRPGYRRVNDGVPDAPYQDTYWDVTGCGNTVDASDPFALRLILDSLRYWVTEMHVDGFRFDLMSALTRVHHRVDTWAATCSRRSARTRSCGT